MIEENLIYIFFYLVSKLAARFNRDLAPCEIDNCKKKDTIAFQGDNCVNIALNFCLKLKGQKRRDKQK